MTKRVFYLAPVFALALAIAAAFAYAVHHRASAGGTVAPVFAEDGVAIHGWDPVAYFVDGRPVKGDPAHTLSHKGVEWRFASAANQDAFAADPDRYAPQYGGWCAWAVAQGYTAAIDPDAWRIVDGKLYLNYSRSVQRRWERDIPGNITAADRNWPELLGGS